MEIIELVRWTCYGLNVIVCLVLAGYFFREYSSKKLRASLAWGIGFGFWIYATVAAAFFIGVEEVTKTALALSIIPAATFVALLYYGASLLFFSEGSFFRGKTAVIYWLAVAFVGWTLTYITPTDLIIERVSLPLMVMFTIGYLVISVLFYRVSRRLPKEDPRRRTVSLVAVSWIIIACWQISVGSVENSVIEAGITIFGTFGYILLLYGMITGKAAT